MEEQQPLLPLCLPERPPNTKYLAINISLNQYLLIVIINQHIYIFSLIVIIIMITLFLFISVCSVALLCIGSLLG